MGFVPLPGTLVVALLATVAADITATEAVKAWFFRDRAAAGA